MNRKVFFAIAGSLLMTAAAFAQPQQRPSGPGPSAPGADAQNNIGSTVTNPPFTPQSSAKRVPASSTETPTGTSRSTSDEIGSDSSVSTDRNNVLRGEYEQERGPSSQDATTNMDRGAENQDESTINKPKPGSAEWRKARE